MSTQQRASERKRSQFGQGMTEYIIIVALIAIAAIGAFGFFGDTVRNQTAGISQELAGQSANADITSAQGAADDARTEAQEHRTLGNYRNNAQEGQGQAGQD